MKNKIFGILLSLSILLSALFTALCPIASYAEEQIIYISSAQEFLDFAKQCSFDAWSSGKSFELTANISLDGEEFAPIPSFSGTFDGKGYTISGVSITGAYSPTGLFSTLSEGGTITNLKVEGVVTPEGDAGFIGGIVGDNSGTVSACVFTGTVIGKSDVGGIVGINRTAGTVMESSSFGEIIGESRSGGIAGSNAGLISSSFNKAKVNTISVTPELTLDELNVSLTLDISKLPSLSSSTVSDTGGIVGYSTGIIIGCENDGEIGYKHIGYNVGGIAGRSSGHLANNQNNGSVYGRKDVGGIVGQMEPYVQYDLSEDLLVALKTELDTMHDLVEDALDISDLRMPTVTQKISNITSLLGDASESLDKLTGYVGSYVDNLTLKANQASAILSNTISEMDDIVDAMGGVVTNLKNSVSALETATNMLLNLEDTLTDDEKEKLSIDIENITTASGKISSGYEKYNQGLKQEGLDEMKAGVEEIVPALVNIGDILSNSEGLKKVGANIVVNLQNALSSTEAALNSVTTMINEIDTLIEYLDSVGTLRLPYLDGRASIEADKLFLALSDLEGEMNGLTSEISLLGSEISPIVREMNDCFSRISNNIINIIYGFSDTNIFDDEVTEDEVMEITYGKIFSCNNSGKINGDINVGGISGVISMEYELDPEDDLSNELSITQKKHYELKAVIHHCSNSGDITAKRDSVGGVIGKMDFGLVFGCEAYCDVKSETGNYVGGIAGITAGKVSDSFAKCSLSGGKYIGGIVGSGVTEDISGASSMVVGCYSIVEISSYKQYAGAISGANAGEFSNNYFVSDSLAGIDRISYHGKAEYISYQDLVKRRIIPNGFYSFDLEFVADGEVIKKISFEYGASFDDTVFPEIPKKDGHYGYWESVSLENLVFDTKVNVIYKPYVTAIGSESERDGKNTFLVEGEFTENDRLIAKPQDIPDISWLNDELFIDNSVIECWKLTIPSDDNESHNIHFLPSVKECRIYLVQNGTQVEADVSELGSYLTFDASGNQIEVVVIGSSVRLLPILLISIGGLLIIATIIVLAIILKRKKAKDKKKK